MGYIVRLPFVVIRISSRQHLHHSVIYSTIRLFPFSDLLPILPHLFWIFYDDKFDFPRILSNNDLRVLQSGRLILAGSQGNFYFQQLSWLFTCPLHPRQVRFFFESRHQSSFSGQSHNLVLQSPNFSFSRISLPSPFHLKLQFNFHNTSKSLPQITF